MSNNKNSDFTNGLLAFLGGAAAVMAIAATPEEEREKPSRKRKPRRKNKRKVISRTVNVQSQARQCATCGHLNDMHNRFCRNCWAKIQ